MVFPKKCNFAQKRLVRAIYSFLVQLTWLLLRLIAKFNPKIRFFVNGRKKTFPLLEKAFSDSEDVIWMHVASLGEYEQGLPVLKQLKVKYPQYTFLLTFFSPSGFEVKKDKTPADFVVYLPMDTQKNVRQFLNLVRPKIAIFIKYEIWPNYLCELRVRNIPAILVSGIFSKRQIFFKWYGGFMKKALYSFSNFFVQEENSKNLLKALNLHNVTVSGDTRFDRVSEILHQENSLAFMDVFKGESKCFVAGSTWPEDEKILLDFINQPNDTLRYVIAPHNIKEGNIANLKSSIHRKVLLYSEIGKDAVSDAEVLIIDTIGLLTKVYSYADFAYVGGGFATGLHNTLEPAVFGIPVIIGPKYRGFNEAVEMVGAKGILVVEDKSEFNQIMELLMGNSVFTEKTGKINSTYISEKTGATQTVIKYIETLF